MHLALYNDTIVFDQATKLVYVICWVHLDDDTTNVSSSSSNGSSNGASASSSNRDPESLREAFDAGKQRLQGLVRQLSTPPPSLAPAQVDMALSQLPAPPGKSNVTKQQFLDAVLAAKEYILVSGEVQPALCSDGQLSQCQPYGCGQHRDSAEGKCWQHSC
jgi:anthranilate/para-aminobenzoate synthase component I